MVDVWGLDPDLLSMIPQPVIALILLFPTKNADGSRAREFTQVEAQPSVGDQVYYLRQLEGHLDNACGTIAMIHSLLNNRSILGLEGGSGIIEKFYEQSKNMNGEERGKLLDTFKDIVDVHNSLVSEGQSQVVESEKVNVIL